MKIDLTSNSSISVFNASSNFPYHYAHSLFLTVRGGLGAAASLQRNPAFTFWWVRLREPHTLLPRQSMGWHEKGWTLVPEVCIICLEELGTKSAYRQLPCEHIFYQPCIDDWVCNRDTRCPLCRKTHYHLRRPRETQPLPNGPLNQERTSENRHGNEAVLGKFNSLKGWCRKRIHGQGVGTELPPPT